MGSKSKTLGIGSQCINQEQDIMNEESSVLESLMLSLMAKSETNIYQILPKGYMVLDIKGRILGYNSKCKQLMGLMNNKRETRSMNAFLVGKNKERFMTMLKFVESKGTVDDFQLEITKPGGQKKMVWISVSAIYDSNKNAIAFHCLMSDMTKELMFLNQIKEELHTLSQPSSKKQHGTMKGKYNS